jgi:glycosyltransferase involved in cell wall biosynthesis
LRIIQIPIIDLPPKHFWFQFEGRKVLSKTLSRLLQDQVVVHAHNTAGAFCVGLKRSLTKPLVVTVHAVPFYDLKTFFDMPLSGFDPREFAFDVLEYPFNQQMIRKGIEGSDSIVTCGYNARAHIKAIYKIADFTNIHVIPNGINFDKIDGAFRHIDISRDPTEEAIVFFCGRLFWRKGIAYLIKAMINLLKRTKKVHLKIFGEGPLRRKMTRWVSDYGLRENVSFYGAVPYSELLKEMKLADIAAFPSLYEIGPFISALEAMACGKPVVAFDFPFAREFIHHMSNGLLAKKGDAKDLSDKLYLLANDASLRLRIGEKAREYVRRNHNWDLLVKEYIKVYDSVV